MALNIKKKKNRTKINFLSFSLRKLEGKEQGGKKERIKYKQKATELKQEKKKFRETKSWFFEKINLMNPQPS